MVAAVAAAAVVAKNARLFIVTSLTLRNLAKADQDSELPTGNSHLSWGCRSDAGTVARTELAEEPVPERRAARRVAARADCCSDRPMSYEQLADADGRANWLPAPSDQFALIVRAYVERR